ncbi:SDR family NAD(P)-dependent oxidoreductase [Asaia krungthepensis]|uniref:Oxidoreductase n=1 Tax=Asaia krungthepensis NRIC 0535 TaxID=1307925 RepID=A0ABQ0Q5I3_9PROT|nr:SDR family oxidoreductase [Asaia krungthepensis]GBQ92280.1 oxidoreductase [Asaia krungthepensis NRIC 0535]
MDTTVGGRAPRSRTHPGLAARSVEPEHAILISGASCDIGRAVALRFARAAYPVILTYWCKCEPVLTLAVEINRAGGRALALPLDIRDRKAIAETFRRGCEAYGRIGVLVNNVGMAGRAVPLAGASPEDLETVIDTNILGTVLMSAEAVRQMSVSAGGVGGVIINISSVATRSGSRIFHVPEATSCGAVEALTKALSDEVAADGIRVVSVAPCAAPSHARMRKNIPSSRAIEADDIAQAVFFLASDQARAITGTTLTVSG